MGACAANSATCTAACTAPKIPSGTECINPPAYNLHVCGANGNRSSNASCVVNNNGSYDASNTIPGYAAGTSLCLLAGTVPSNDTCRDPEPTGSCDIPNISCSIGTKAGDNNLTTPGSTRQWYCGASSNILCEYINPTIDQPICNSTYYTCVVGTAGNGNGSNTRTCGNAA